MGNQVGIKQKFVNLLQASEESDTINLLKEILLTDLNSESYSKAIYPSDIRTILERNPNKIEWIVTYINQFLQVTQLEPHTEYRQIKNCLRLVTSIVPILYEKGNKEYMIQLLWCKRFSPPNEESSERDPPLLIALLRRIVELAFTIGFTIDFENDSEIMKHDNLVGIFLEYYKKIWNGYELKLELLWKGFNPQCKYPNDQMKFIENRHLVLSAIYSLISSSLFQEHFFECEGSKITQYPNAALLALQKLPLFPELLVSIVAYAVFPTERLSHMIVNFLPFQNLDECALVQTSLQLTHLVLGGQSMVLRDEDYIADKRRMEMYLASGHFKYHQCPFPQLITLPAQIKERIIAQSCQKLYHYYKCQQQLMRGNLEKQISDFENSFLFQSYLAISIQSNVPNLMIVYLLASFHPMQYISKISRCMLLHLSQQDYLSKQFSQPIDFILSFQNFPLTMGNWIDLYIIKVCEEISIKQQLNSKYSNKLKQVASILYNLSTDCGKLNELSAQRIVHILGELCNYDIFLRSPIILQAIQLLIQTLLNIIYKQVDDSQNLVFPLLQMIKQISMMAHLKLNDQKLKHWFTKHMDPQMDKSFIQEKNPLNQDVQDRRDSELRSVTQQFSTSHKQAKSLSLMKEEQPQNQNENEQLIISPRQANYQKYLDNWHQFVYDTTAALELESFLLQITKLMISTTDRNELSLIYTTHNVATYIKNYQLSPKISLDLFKGYKLMTKQIWGQCLRSGTKFPYFEKTQCPFFVNELLK